MESKKRINLKVFGLEKEINLSEKCKMYNDLIEKIKKSNNKDTEKYIKCIEKCIKHRMLNRAFDMEVSSEVYDKLLSDYEQRKD